MRVIPSYELYGDLLAGGLSDSIHHETIKERSSRHDWTIRLHRHRRLGQIFLFRTSGVFFRIGEVEHTSTEPMILIIPPEVPHGFLFAEDVLGDVVSVRLDDVSPDIEHQFAQLTAETDMIFRASETIHFEQAAELIHHLSLNFRSISAGRTDILSVQVNLIALYLTSNRQQVNTSGHPKVAEQRARKDIQIEGFCKLLEDHFQDPWSVADYANSLKISAPHLTRLCRSNLGSPPNNLVRQRRLLEAKRLLEYTGLSIAEIAHRCGFRDTAFFCRTFKSNMDATPKAYRMNLSPRSFTK